VLETQDRKLSRRKEDVDDKYTVDDYDDADDNGQVDELKKMMN